MRSSTISVCSNLRAFSTMVPYLTNQGIRGKAEVKRIRTHYYHVMSIHNTACRYGMVPTWSTKGQGGIHQITIGVVHIHCMVVTTPTTGIASHSYTSPSKDDVLALEAEVCASFHHHSHQVKIAAPCCNPDRPAHTLLKHDFIGFYNMRNTP